MLENLQAKLAIAIQVMMQPHLRWLYNKLNKRLNGLYQVIQELFYRLRSHDIVEHAYGLAFNFTLAIFPAIIFSFTLIPYIPITALEPKIITFLQDIMPESVYEALLPTIQDTVSKQRSGLLSFGFVSTLYLATNGMVSLIKTFNIADKQASGAPRGYLRQRLVATLLTVSVALALFATILLLTVVRQVLDYMLMQGLITWPVQAKLMLSARSMIIFFMFFTIIASIYYLAPATKQHKSFVSVGALVATLSSLIASFGFSYYVNNFAHYNRLYGSLGVMIALMIWLFLLSVILLAGFELNISIAQTLEKQSNKYHKQ